MSLEGFLLGIIALAVGAAFTFYGFKFFLILLPLWAFVAGFAAGAQAMSVLFGEGFLTTVLGWVIGFLTGAVFAVLSYLWYWAAVALLGGLVGYQLGVGLLALISLTGFVAVAIGVLLGVVFAVGTIVLGVPRALVVVLTSLGGAATIVAGALLILGRVSVDQLGTVSSARSSTTTSSGCWPSPWSPRSASCGSPDPSARETSTRRNGGTPEPSTDPSSTRRVRSGRAASSCLGDVADVEHPTPVEHADGDEHAERREDEDRRARRSRRRGRRPGTPSRPRAAASASGPRRCRRT